MSALSPEQIVQVSEAGAIVLGIAIVWAVYHGSENAELPGDAVVPPPGESDEATPDTAGRTLS